MTKPINIQAQRVYNIIHETIEKLNIVAWLGNTLFEMRHRKDDLVNIFGEELGTSLLTHADLEQSFLQNNIGPDGRQWTQLLGKVYDLKDEYISDEAKETAELLRRSIRNIVRMVYRQPGYMKIRKDQGEIKNIDFLSFLQSYEDLKSLFHKKLTTPVEEEISMESQIKELTQRNNSLMTTRDTKQENLRRFLDEKKKAKDANSAEIEELNKMISNEQLEKETRLNNIREESQRKMRENQEHHEETKKNLEQQIEGLEKEIAEILKSNSNQEMGLRNEFKRIEGNLFEKIKEYDGEMEDKEAALEDINGKFESEKQEMQDIDDLFKQINSEKTRIEDEERQHKKKEAERNEELTLLNKAAQWVQAHWRGLLDRRAYEKMRKKKKKRGKKR